MVESGGTVLTAAILIGLLVPEIAEGQWPIKEFEVLNVEPAGDVAPFGALVELLRELDVDLDNPLDLDLWRTVPLSEATRNVIETHLRESASILEGWGFPPPALEPVVQTDRGDAYRVFLVTDRPDYSGAYHGELCYGGRETVIVLAAEHILDASGNITRHGLQTVGHELFHSVQYASPFFANAGCESVGHWITEGQARALGWDLVRIARGLDLSQDGIRVWGPRSYSKRLPVPRRAPSGTYLDPAYETMSFWRYLAEYRARGTLPGPEVGPVDYSYLAAMLRQAPAGRDCNTAGAECDSELRWLDLGVQREFGLTLRMLYPRFIDALADYGKHRQAADSDEERDINKEAWQRAVFNRPNRDASTGCGHVYLTSRPSQRVAHDVIARFEDVAAECWEVLVEGFDGAVTVQVEVAGPPGATVTSLSNLSAAVAGLPIWADTAEVVIDPNTDQPSATWYEFFWMGEAKTFTLSSVARDPAATTRMTNLPITFTVLEPGAIVSFGSSVSGQNPYDFNPTGAGQYEAPKDRVKFAVQYISPDGNACVGGINLPTADDDEQDLVVIWGGFPLPLTTGDFPIEPPPTYPEREFPAPPAPVTDATRPGVLGAQVYLSCEHGGCGEEPWGAPIRPIDSFRGTFRIRKISRTQVVGSFDMVAVDEPVRVSATFVAPLGGPRGLSPGHPCAPDESGGTLAGQGTSAGGGGGSEPQPGDPAPDADPEPSPDPNPGSDSLPDTGPGVGPTLDEAQTAGTNTPSPTDVPSDPSAQPDPRNEHGDVGPGPLVETERMGMIEATVDGERRTWYVVEAWTNTGRYASGKWENAEGAGNKTLVLEGFDTQALPLESFATGPAGASYGSYRGSVITITVPIAGDGGSIRMDLTGGESGATANYLPDAGSGGDRHVATGGSIQGDWGASDDGSIRLEGRFEGVFRAEGAGQSIRFEDGTLTVEGIPPGMILRR